MNLTLNLSKISFNRSLKISDLNSGPKIAPPKQTRNLINRIFCSKGGIFLHISKHYVTNVLSCLQNFQKRITQPSIFKTFKTVRSIDLTGSKDSASGVTCGKPDKFEGPYRRSVFGRLTFSQRRVLLAVRRVLLRRSDYFFC